MPAEEQNETHDTKFTHVDLADGRGEVNEYSTRPKSDELIQAQIAAFVAEKLYRDADGADHVLDEIVRLSAMVHPAAGVYRDPSYFELKHSPEDTAPKIVATRAEYTQFLREVGGANYAPIARRAELLSNFKHFDEAVATIIDRTPTVDSRKLDPDTIGSGTFAEGFPVQHDGKEYVARIPRRYDHELNDFTTKLDPHNVDGRIQDCLLGMGMPHLEQIVAASYELGTTVSEKLPGTPLQELDASMLDKISNEQLITLIDTTQQAHGANIFFDLQPGNFLYDEKVGFGVIDYEGIHPIYGGQQDVADVVLWFGKEVAKIRAKLPQKNASDQDTQLATSLSQRLVKICDEKLPFDQADKVREALEDIQ